MVKVRGLPSTCMLAFLPASHDSNRRLVEGEWVDPGIPDPLSDMFALLTARRNRALTQQWGVWLAGKDAERALKVRHHAILFFGALRVPDVISQLLTSHGSAKRGQNAEDEAATLQQIRAVNPEAGVRFLEHLVLQKRRTVCLSLGTVCPIHRHVVTDTHFQDLTLHTSLALTYIEEVLSFLTDDATSKLWRAKGVGLSPFFLSPCSHRRILTTRRHIVSSYSLAASYASSSNPSPFLTYFEATTPASPAKHARLRTALFLQTSSAYDASAAGALLGPHAPLLAPELAIIASKVRAQLYPFPRDNSETKNPNETKL
jgi:vacuolar protein sorting-associated protein 3